MGLTSRLTLPTVGLALDVGLLMAECFATVKGWWIPWTPRPVEEAHALA